jgi:hypothetical protein
MGTINPLEGGPVAYQAQPFSKSRDTAPSVSAHGAFKTVCIEIPHPEIVLAAFLQYDQPVCPDPKPAVA